MNFGSFEVYNLFQFTLCFARLDVTVRAWSFDDGYNAKYKYVKPTVYLDCCLSIRHATRYTNTNPLADRHGPSLTNIPFDRLLFSTVNAASPFPPTRMNINQTSRLRVI